MSTFDIVDGLDRAGVKRDNHPKWYPPTNSDGVGLMVRNSLTETMEPFAPRNGRQVKWYTCGPTVYDASHMGHARAYLTFDILRRIMEDYFGYSVQYQMNITDIDDKIIKRARVNKLVDDYKTSLGSGPAAFTELQSFVAQAVEKSESSLNAKIAALVAPLDPSTTSRVAAEREEKLKETELKRDQLQETKSKIAAAITAANFNGLFDAATGVVGELLDSLKGHTITDHSIFDEHSRKFERMFFEDCQRLGIREPDVVTRVTEYVPQVVDFIKKIETNGFAYKGETSVFFDTEAFTAAGYSYAKLKGGADKNTSEEEMAEGEGTLSKGVKGEKKSPNDFALWKFSKPGEPSWASPWGEGRPGWHIECSVMASDILGENMDIHGGGWDLKFPHHDNECAQSEAHFCQHQWVNYFFHCGHLHIKGLKMSKSLKNFITIRQALGDELGVSPRIMRLLFLSFPWDKQMNFGDDSLKEAAERDRVLRSFFGSIDVALRKDYYGATQGFNQADRALNAKWVEVEQRVHSALQQNFDTPSVIVALFELVAHTNQYLLGDDRVSGTLLRKVAAYITKILRVFGVIQGSDAIGYVASTDSRLAPALDVFTRFRDEVRTKAKEVQQMPAFLPLCDAIRDEWLIPAGVRLEDKPGGGPTTWKVDEPELLQKEADARKAALVSDRLKKIQNQIETKRKLVAKWDQFVAPPSDLFRGEMDKYSAFDDAGVPTKDAKGEDLGANVVKKLKKEQEKYAASHTELAGKGGVAWLREQKQELADMEAQLTA
jgi:cysteinyl-tRNA synthetase